METLPVKIHSWKPYLLNSLRYLFREENKNQEFINYFIYFILEYLWKIFLSANNKKKQI